MNEDYKEFDDLLKGFVDDSLSDVEQGRFEEILKTDSEARKRYLDYIEVESMLASHKVKVEHARPVSQKNKMRLTTNRVVRTKTTNFTKTRKSGAFLILAASLFLALSLAYYMKFIKKPERVSFVDPEPKNQLKVSAKILKVSGDASILVDGKSSKASEGRVLLSGTKISSSHNAEIVFQTEDGSTIGLAPDSVLTYSKLNGQLQLKLEKGFIKADVNKQPVRKPLVVFTKNGVMTVLGTILRTGVMKEATTLTVDEGRVEIKNTKGQAVIVNSHETATATPGVSLKVRNISKYKVNKLEILSAFYGAENKWVDLTPQVRSRAGNSRLISTGSFKELAGDPNYGIVKSLKIAYKINGQQGSMIVSEYTGEVVASKFFRTEVILPEL